jgi:hypothetical protein
MEKQFDIGFLNRLEMKFLKITLPLMLLTASLLFGIIEVLSATRAMEELRSKQQALAQSHSVLISNWVWNLDRIRIKLSLETLMADKAIVGAQVVDEWGDELASIGILVEEGEDLSKTAEIFFETDSGVVLVGRTTIFVTDRLVKNQFRHQLLHDGSILLLPWSQRS